MIYVRLEGHDFRYEVTDVLKLFFDNEEILFVDDEPPAKDRGFFISSSIKGKDGNIEVYTHLKASGINTGYHFPVRVSGDDHARRKQLKREMKRQLYIILSEYTRRELPWGMLTGIRPAKIVHELLYEGLKKDEILKRLREYYFVSENKASLLYDVAAAENSILSKTSPDMAGIYVGIPFCPSRCLYCSFASNPIDRCRHIVRDYVDALRYEIEETGRIIKQKGFKIQSIYMGGGTPTSLDAEHLKEVLGAIEGNFDLTNLEEFTMEAGRPDSIDRNKLTAIRNSRVDRISINPQTMWDETLKAIGRRHTAKDIIEAFRLAREMGFDNINMDVIIGLPGENISMFKRTLEQIGELGPESLTVHTMAVKRASRLNEVKDRYVLLDAGEASDMIELAGEHAKLMGMHPYYLYRQKNMVGNLENIGYCKPGMESIYNIQIMEERQTIIALGAGAITKVVYPEENRIERAFNVKNVEEYIRRTDEMVERKKALLANELFLL